jgi:hypothetical protein
LSLLYNTQAKNPCLWRTFLFVLLLFFFVSFLSTVYLYILCPHVTYYSATHNTNFHVPGGFQIRNPRKQPCTLDCAATGSAGIRTNIFQLRRTLVSCLNVFSYK